MAINSTRNRFHQPTIVHTISIYSKVMKKIWNPSVVNVVKRWTKPKDFHHFVKKSLECIHTICDLSISFFFGKRKSIKKKYSNKTVPVNLLLLLCAIIRVCCVLVRLHNNAHFLLDLTEKWVARNER